jgi:hypothetical protein
VVNESKTCAWVDFYVGGDLCQVIMMPCMAICAFVGPSLLLHPWERNS